MEEIRINKYIASSGVCSRRKAEEYILAGKVLVNGVVNTELGYKVKEEDIVVVDGKQISLEENKVYIMLNKPKGYVTTSQEQFGRPSVLDIVKVEERVYPVGRLDMDSEGLLILTNDGEFSNNVIHPTKHISKKYEVVLKENITETAIKKLESGVDIGGYVTRPAKVEKVTDKKILNRRKKESHRLSFLIFLVFSFSSSFRFLFSLYAWLFIVLPFLYFSKNTRLSALSFETLKSVI